MTKIAKNYYLFLICIVFALWGCIGRVSLTSPADGTTIQLGQLGNLSLQQQTVTNADSYDLQVSTFSGFTFNTIDKNTTSTSYDPLANELNHNTTYYWRVRAKSNNQNGDWSDKHSFNTFNTTRLSAH